MDLHTEPFVPKIRMHVGHPNEILPQNGCLFHTSEQPLQAFLYRWAGLSLSSVEISFRQLWIEYSLSARPWEGTWESRQKIEQCDPTSQMRMGKVLDPAASYGEAMEESRRAKAG